jgi:hypothetical protein
MEQENVKKQEITESIKALTQLIKDVDSPILRDVKIPKPKVK